MVVGVGVLSVKQVPIKGQHLSTRESSWSQPKAPWKQEYVVDFPDIPQVQR